MCRALPMSCIPHQHTAFERLSTGRAVGGCFQAHRAKTSSVDLQSNRLRALGNALSSLTRLEELYLSHNAITSLVEGATSDAASSTTETRTLCLGPLATLHTIDLSSNRLTSLDGFEGCAGLRELWVASNIVADYEAVSVAGAALPDLDCVYLEHNPVAKEWDYRSKVREIFPALGQIDATVV